MPEAFLLKGTPTNLSWSLIDMKNKKTPLLRDKPDNWMIWGINQRFTWITNQLQNSEIFIYVIKSEATPGGLAIYGIAREILQLTEKYWPQGEKWVPFLLEIKAAAPGVLEHPEDPKQWKLIPKAKLQEKGIKIMRGPQKLKPEQAKMLREIFPQRTRAGHEDVKGWLREVGELLGYHVVIEYESEGYRFDVAWWGSERDFKGGKRPAAVFEVQRSGSLVEALARLKHALDKWNINGLYLVVTDEEDVDKARRLVEPHLKGSFHELMGRVRVRTAKMIEEVRDALVRYRDEVRELSTLRD
jgi:hypothetical protein